VLAADADVAGGAVTTPIANLDYFPLGEADVLQAHPMAGPAFISLLDRLTKAYRFVVIELPELHAWPEGRSALAAVDGAHVVARLDASERAHVVDTIAAIHHAGARLLGGIVQDAAAS
jgi:Mrp family chromosome partitioning ATPase